MTWALIELALARTAEHPEGSSEFRYLLRVPLTADHLIDRAALTERPGDATVRRSFKGEHGRLGSVVAKPGGFAFSYEPGDADDETIIHLENHPLLPGNYITVREADGAELPFRVVAEVPATEEALIYK